MERMIQVLVENCLGCGICSDVCPTRALVQTREMPLPEYYFDRCTLCLECFHQCPFAAIEVVEKEVTSQAG